MTATEERISVAAADLEIQLTCPTSPSDPAGSWLLWLTLPNGAPLGTDHPLLQLCAGATEASYFGMLCTGSQLWWTRAVHVTHPSGAAVHVRAWKVDSDLAEAAAADPAGDRADAWAQLPCDVTGRPLSSPALIKADELFRNTVEILDQAVYLFRPIWDHEHIVDLEVMYCNGSALNLPFAGDVVPGALGSAVFKDPELAMVSAEVAWRGEIPEPYTIVREGLVDGIEQSVRYEVHTRRVSDFIVQTSTDHTAADELERSESRQRLILDSLSEGVTLFAPMFDDNQQMLGTHILYGNRATQRFYGSGLGLFEGVTGKGNRLDAARHAWETGTPAIRVIDRMGSGDDGGEDLYVELEANRVGDLIVQVARDRTAEMRSLRAREMAEGRFSATIEALSEAVGIWTPMFGDDGAIVDLVLRYANRSLGGESSVGTLASAVPVDADIVDLARQAFELGGLPVTAKTNVRGNKRNMTCRTSLVQVGNEVVSVATDISEMEAVLGRLSASESLLRSVLGSLSDSVRVYDNNGRIEYANEASVALLGPLPVDGEPFNKSFVLTDADGAPLDSSQYPLSRGLRGEAVSEVAVGFRDDSDTEPRVCNVTVRPLFDDGSDVPSRVVVSTHDVTAIRKHAAELEWFNTHKRQTRLLNLEGFTQHVHERTRQAGGSFALIWISLTELESIRPMFGFTAGDTALVSAAAMVSAIAEQYGAIAAQPEDSALALLIPNVASGSQVHRIAEDLARDLSVPFTSDSMSLLLGPVIGIAIGPLHGTDAATLIRRSQTAAWHAGKTGVDVLRWRADLGAAQHARVSLLGEFDRALGEEQIFLEFQPKFDVATRALVGAEALVRWMHPTKGRLAPHAFIEGVEASALCRPFTLWAIRDALTRWAPVAERHPHSKVAVNVPVPLLSDLDFLEQLADELVRIGADPSWLQIEITERGLTGNVEDLQAGLEQISMLGISVALDDFGTGQSSLAFLRTLPLNEVKIDRAFITNLQVDVANQAIVRACVAIAGTTSMRVCAEGVETDEEMSAIADLGCDFAQGFLLGRPMSITSLLAIGG